MIEYGKTENLFYRDPETHALLPEYRVPEVGLVRDDAWLFTEKVDGTNVRLIWTPDTGLQIKGRSDRANLPKGFEDDVQMQVSCAPCWERLHSEVLKLPEDCGLCFYGEGYGAGIQKVGGIYRDQQAGKSVRVFDLATFRYTITKEGWVTDENGPGYQVIDVQLDGSLAYRDWATLTQAAEHVGLSTVPLISRGDPRSHPLLTLREMVDMVARGFNTMIPEGPGGPAEGVVARTDPYLFYGRNRSRLIFKCKTADLQNHAATLFGPGAAVMA